MIKIPVFDSKGQLTVEVEINREADVFLLDATNYKKYIAKQKFTYYGGHYKSMSPIKITVNGSGRWYLIVRGTNVKYSYKYY